MGVIYDASPVYSVLRATIALRACCVSGLYRQKILSHKANFESFPGTKLSHDRSTSEAAGDTI